MMGTIRAILLSTAAAGVLVAFQNCAPAGQSSRAPAADQMQMNGGTTTDNPKATVDVSIMPHSVTALQNATICVEDVYFKRVSRFRSTSTEALRKAGKDLAKRLKGRDITVVKEGTYIDAFQLPHGDYNMVELVLDDDCQADKSLTLVNSAGGFATRDRLTLRFDGNGSGGGALQLNMQPLLEMLVHVRSGGDIKRALEGVRGTFQ